MTDHHVSVSQIETYRACARKWGFRYLDGIDSPPGAGAVLGSKVHSELEKYLVSRNPTDLSKIAAAGVEFLPTPDEPIDIEHAFEMVLEGVPFTGRIDIFQASRKPPRVIDHKTTSGRQWAKKSLENDLQAAIYAEYAARATGEKDIELLWIYYLTRGKPQSWPVHYWKDTSTVEHKNIIQSATEDGKRMLSIRSHDESALDLPPSWDACSMYGGCPHRETCMANETKKLTVEINAARAEKVEPHVINPPESETLPATLASSFKLYIDCRPIRSPELVVELSTFIRPLLDKIAAEYGVADYRLIEYGKGPAALSSLLRQSILANPLRGLSIVASSRAQESQHCLFVLAELASEIVQGL